MVAEKRVYECCWCDDPFTPKEVDRTSCCSRECGFKWAGLLRTARNGNARAAYTVYRGKCANCDKRYLGRPGSLTCSETCGKERSRRLSLNKSIADNDERDIECRHCGVLFKREYGTRAHFCSDNCRQEKQRDAKRTARKRRKAIERGATVAGMVNPITVFERDAWKCQLCGKRTPKARRGTYEANAPELDHIIPISKGGEHSYANTQLLCRSCNAAKGAVTLGQLRMFCEPAA